VQQVAFFRNVNQGQRGHPSTADLVDAFRAAGADDASSFQSNGTILFTAMDAAALAIDIRERLAARGVFDDLVEVRSLDFIERVVVEHATAADGHRRELALFDIALRLGESSTVVREATRRRCSVVDDGPGWAVVRNDRDRQSNGTPTVQAITGSPATSRGMPTLVRLVERFGGSRD
jgi:uncharacterized protein (DUF1697 family)